MSLADLTRDDAARLVEVTRWALARGWQLRQAGWVSPDGLTAVDVNHNGVRGLVAVVHRSSREFPFQWFSPGPWRSLAVRNVTEAVDWLVLCGVLPARFGSGFAEGEAFGREYTTEAVMSGAIRPLVEQWWGDLNAPAGDEPFQHGRKSGYLWGVEETLNAVCAALGVAEPMWDDMRQTVLKPKVEALLADLGARQAVTDVNA